MAGPRDLRSKSLWNGTTPIAELSALESRNDEQTALPTLPTVEMARQDQIDILLNQATAVIVCSYLEHMNTAINKGLTGATTATTAPGPVGLTRTDTGFITTAELVSLINDVQGALRNIQ